MVTFIFTIFDYEAFVFIDPGFTCSFISHEFALRVHGIIKPLEHSLCVSMLTEGIVVVNLVLRACLILVDG